MARDRQVGETAVQPLTTYFLRTARLGFRRWQPDDSNLAISLWGDPRVTEWIDARTRLNERQVCKRLEEEIASDTEFGVQYFPIFLLDGDVFVGCCGLRPYQGSMDTLEVGVHIRPLYWRQGLAFEAATAAIDYAFDVVGAGALLMGHHPENTRSRDLIEKLGFQFSHTELYAPTGLDHPSYLRRRTTG